MPVPALGTIVKLAWDAITCMLAITGFRERIPKLWIILKSRRLMLGIVVHLFILFPKWHFTTPLFNICKLGLGVLILGIESENSTEICGA